MSQFQDIQKLLFILVKLNEWEQKHLSEFSGTIGRRIFFNLVHHFCNENSGDIDSMKKIYSIDDISERAIRNKINSYKDSGLLAFSFVSQDKRSKKAVPTEKTINYIIDYGLYVSFLLKSNYVTY